MDAETKTCSKCGEVKPVDAFGKHCWCKLCKSAYNKAYYEANPEKIRARSKDYNQANPEKRRAWREASREKIRAQSKTYSGLNYEKRLAQNRAWAKANHEKVYLKSKAWHEANPEKVRAISKAYYEANPEKIRAKTAKAVNHLLDCYVLHLITKETPLKASDVPQSLIDLKRVQVQITRKLKELKKCK